MQTEPEKSLQGTAKPVGQILETLESYVAQQTTARQPRASNGNSEKKKRQWLDKWLCLRKTHNQLTVLEDAVWRFAAEYAKRPWSGRTLVIYGENGCGKTKTAKAMHRWAISIAKLIPTVNSDETVRLSTVEFAHWPSVVDGFKKQEFDKTDELRDCELCVIDDIGAEHDPSGFGREQLYLILCRREFRWNILTTNLPPGEWESRLERRIASRLFRNAQHIDLSNVPDYGTL